MRCGFEIKFNRFESLFPTNNITNMYHRKNYLNNYLYKFKQKTL